MLFDADRAIEVDERMISCAYLENADKSKFENTMKGLASQKILENDQFPKTIAKACSVLSNHNDQKHKKPCKSKWKDGENEN